MIKEFLLKLKIKRAQKKLNHLDNISNLHDDLKYLNDEIEKQKESIKSYRDFEKDRKKKNKKKFENLDESIFDRCKKCDQIFLKSDKHTCVY